MFLEITHLLLMNNRTTFSDSSVGSPSFFKLCDFISSVSPVAHWTSHLWSGREFTIKPLILSLTFLTLPGGGSVVLQWLDFFEDTEEPTRRFDGMVAFFWSKVFSEPSLFARSKLIPGSMVTPVEPLLYPRKSPLAKKTIFSGFFRPRKNHLTTLMQRLIATD